MCVLFSSFEYVFNGATAKTFCRFLPPDQVVKDGIRSLTEILTDKLQSYGMKRLGNGWLCATVPHRLTMEVLYTAIGRYWEERLLWARA
jgi:hypothetical protein